jgi:hypothetical protein
LFLKVALAGFLIFDCRKIFGAHTAKSVA